LACKCRITVHQHRQYLFVAIGTTPLMAQWLEALLDAVARLDGDGDERAETIAMIQAVMALRQLEKEARQ
jgi:hypothetical protein